MQPKIALITGGSRRIGAGIAELLHQEGMNIILHYRNSVEDAQRLANTLNEKRPNSVALLQMDLLNTSALSEFIAKAQAIWGYFDVLINNASTFYPTPMGTVNEEQWADLVGSNLTAPFFLSQAAMPILSERKGNIINIIDIKADRPAKRYPVYSIAKAGLWMLTKTLAKELAPNIRVNAIAPGAMIPPEDQTLNPEHQYEMIKKIPLQRIGTAEDIARTVLFLINQAPYITGQMIAVDGGRGLYTSGDRD
ncbi:pteridine reductase [uncultured Legionella sp.]|uniref:pteridine reductase n=1 Tax=uncultured Legionella sp. TaxID=210934 RepID=UPI0026252622|nr:pteridine reductase [uncultured Legionella sp.]